jgi:hypothetical protein
MFIILSRIFILSYWLISSSCEFRLQAPILSSAPHLSRYSHSPFAPIKTRLRSCALFFRFDFPPVSSSFCSLRPPCASFPIVPPSPLVLLLSPHAFLRTHSSRPLVSLTFDPLRLEFIRSFWSRPPFPPLPLTRVMWTSSGGLQTTGKPFSRVKGEGSDFSSSHDAPKCRLLFLLLFLSYSPFPPFV